MYFLLAVVVSSLSLIAQVLSQHRFCCEDLRIVQRGKFRPKECPFISSCSDTKSRNKEFVKLFSCAMKRGEENAKFPDVTVRTDRTDGWTVFKAENDTSKNEQTKDGLRYRWSLDKDGIIYEVSGTEGPPSANEVTFYNNSKLNAIWSFKNGDDKNEIYEVPEYVSIYPEPCRDFNNLEVTYIPPAETVYKSMDLLVAPSCRFIPHYSLSKSPFQLISPYFNEMKEEDVQQKLVRPNSTTYFDLTDVDGRKGYFAFPYFVVIRLLCQDEGFYGEEVYSIASSGAYPGIVLQYQPSTTRDTFANPVRISLNTALIDLEQDTDKLLVPDLNLERDEKLRDRDFRSTGNSSKRICSLNICNPAFAAPMPFLNIPIIKLEVPERRTVEGFSGKIYASPYHARDVKGAGEIYVAKKFTLVDSIRNVTTVHPRYFFPEDLQTDSDEGLRLGDFRTCTISEAAEILHEFDIPASFYFRGKQAELEWAIKEMETRKSALPLTQEDFFVPKYTLGTSPVVGIAGFYNPTLVILGDPEMSEINQFQWDYDQGKKPFEAIFSNNNEESEPPEALDCLTQEEWINLGDGRKVPKPIYSVRDKHDYRKNIVRRTHFPLDYSSYDTKAIFDIISLEDRLLLKTAKGLVTFYGHNEFTPDHEKHFTAPKNERVPRCFKIIKVLPIALFAYDPILAITYDYEGSTGRHEQEIWYGTYTKEAEPIVWDQIGGKKYDDETFEPIHVNPALTSLGTSEENPEHIEICLQVYRDYILKLFKNDANRTEFNWKQNPDLHKCVIIDGTPMPTRPDRIQILIKMTFTYYKDIACNPKSPDYKCPNSCKEFDLIQCIRVTTDENDKDIYECDENKRSHLAVIEKDCPCKTKASCFERPFGPCQIGRPRFCPQNIFKTRPFPYCPLCIQSWNGSKEGDYNEPYSYIPRVEEEKELNDNEECKRIDDFSTVCEDFHIQHISLYVIAEHDVGKSSRGSNWNIVSVLPKRPCTAPHYEVIRTVLNLDRLYFNLDENDDTLRETCYEKFAVDYAEDLNIIGFTYTRQLNTHLFMYGTRLYHSTNAGHSFTVSRDFPKYPSVYDKLDYDMVKILNSDMIRVLAFSSSSYYAFLTSKRDLWIGTVGSLRLIRLRPSPGYSMINLKLYKGSVGITDAVPFALMFDSNDNLFELVAVRSSTRNIRRIFKRPIDIETMMRNDYMVEVLHDYVNKQIIDSLINPTSNFDQTEELRTQPLKINQGLYIHYDVTDLALYCPYSKFQFKQNYSKTLSRLQRFTFSSPIQHVGLGLGLRESSLMTFSVAAFSLFYQVFLNQAINNFYSNINRDPFERWIKQKREDAEIGFLHYLRDNPEQYGILVDPRSYSRVIDVQDKSEKVFLPHYWLDYNQTVKMEFQFFIKNNHFLSRTDFILQRLSEVQLSVDNGDGTLLRISTEREEVARVAAVKFTVYVSLFHSDRFIVAVPGEGLVPITVGFHLIGGFGKCFNIPHWGMVGSALAATFIAGCQPATDLLFDWNSTLSSLQFRNPTEKYGDSSYCYLEEQVCFYARESLVFSFDILDLSKQKYVPFGGKFKLRVIGGGRSKDEIVDYTNDQIDAFNIPGKSDVSLIWSVEEEKVDKDAETQENILTAGQTRIRWSCNTLSPCARVLPNINLRTVYYFKILITNRGVDKGTLCLHERELIIQVYGFPPSPEVLLLTTLFFCVLILGIMYMFYYCCRRHRKVWRANKVRLIGWSQIIIDTFPKPLKTKAEPGKDGRHDKILLSLQGRLKVPKVVGKREGGSKSQSSTSSDESEGSEVSNVSLPKVKARKAGATWTDMVYEQIISKRLLSIVEKNKRIRQQITSSPVPRELDQNEVAREQSYSDSRGDEEKKNQLLKKSV